MFGTIVNALSVFVCGMLGVFLKKGLPKRIETVVMQLVGVGVTVIGFNGAIVSMVSADTLTGRLSDSNGILLVLSLVIGGVTGELLRIDDRITAFGLSIEKKLGAEGFAKGFVTASILYCVGAMAIVGALNDGFRGDSSILLTKSTLDSIMAVVLGSSLGIGVPFSAIPILLYQGAIALFAGLLAPVLSDGVLLDLICMVGYCIVALIGTNLMGLTKIKTANLIPALLVPVGYNLLLMIKNV